MARSARLVIPGLPHLVVQHGAVSRAAFRDDADRRLYLQLLGRQCRTRNLRVLAWSLLPAAAELVAVPGKASVLAGALGEAHRLYALARNRAEGGAGRLFRGRFASCVLDERHLAAAIRRVALGAVRLGLVRAAEDWPWSSAGYHLGLRRADPLIADREAVAGIPGRQAVLAPADETAELKLTSCLRTGRPAGDRRFVIRLERLTGRRLRRGRPGRPGRDAAGAAPAP